MYLTQGIQNIEDAHKVIYFYNYEAKIKVIMGAALGIFFGAFIAVNPSNAIYCSGGFAAPISYCLIRDILDGGQKEYKEAKKTLENKLC